MSSYFTLPSFARAKKNTEDLEKTNPQNPVLNDDDEKFLEKQISRDDAAPGSIDVDPTIIFDNGEQRPATAKEQEDADVASDQVAIPETQPAAEGPTEDETKATPAEEQSSAAPEAGDGAQESKDASSANEVADDPPEEVPDEQAVPAKKPKKDKGMELPSQEEAEAATAGWGVGSDIKTGNEKRTWASYLPSMPAGNSKTAESTSQSGQRSWTEYASTIAPSSLPSMPSMPNMPSLPNWLSKDKDAKLEPVYNEDGTINEEKTKEKQEKEVSVLLDNLNLSQINNRVFAFSNETQHIYERFALVLRDTMNGGPTAYEDMEKLMKEAGPQLEKQFKSMPPFVQTLVKALPAKLGTTMGPELFAAASASPDADLKTRMAVASKSSAGAAAGAAAEAGTSGDKKKKKVTGLKSLVSSQGAAAGILRNTVTFVQTRFPFLASASNVVMSLSVFILMFTFWYCHKRGKETRLALEGEEAKAEGEENGEDFEATDDEGLKTPASQDQEPVAVEKNSAQMKADILNQPHPNEIPLPADEEEEANEKA